MKVKMARFTTPDPVIPDIFDGQSFNAFSYVWNNPLSFVDPSGFDPEEVEYRSKTYIIEDPDTGDLGLLMLYWRADQPEPKPPANAIDEGQLGAATPPLDVGTTGVSGAPKVADEGFSSFIDGLVMGSLSDNTSTSATIGSIVGGFVPVVGLLADVRDFGAAIAHVANGDDGAARIGCVGRGVRPGR